MAGTAKTRRATGTSQSRFGRTTATPRGRFARSAATPRRSSPTHGLRRRAPEPSGVRKVMGAMLPTTAAKKAAPSSKKGKAGGLARVAAAAGVAFKNRGKLSELRRKDSPATPTSASGNNAAVPPATPAV